MRRVRSESDLQRLALSMGAELDCDGKVFNSERAIVDQPPPKPPDPATMLQPLPPLPAPPPPPDYMTREQVELLLEQREAKLVQHIEQLLARIPAPVVKDSGETTLDVEVHREDGYGYQPIRRLVIKKKAGR